MLTIAWDVFNDDDGDYCSGNGDGGEVMIKVVLVMVWVFVVMRTRQKSLLQKCQCHDDDGWWWWNLDVFYCIPLHWNDHWEYAWTKPWLLPSGAGLLFLFVFACVFFVFAFAFVFLCISSKWPTGICSSQAVIIARGSEICICCCTCICVCICICICISSKWPPGICSSQALIVAQRHRTPPVTTIIITGGHWPRETVSCHHISFDVITYSRHHFQESYKYMPHTSFNLNDINLSIGQSCHAIRGTGITHQLLKQIEHDPHIMEINWL